MKRKPNRFHLFRFLFFHFGCALLLKYAFLNQMRRERKKHTNNFFVFKGLVNSNKTPIHRGNEEKSHFFPVFRIGRKG